MHPRRPHAHVLRPAWWPRRTRSTLASSETRTSRSSRWVARWSCVLRVRRELRGFKDLWGWCAMFNPLRMSQRLGCVHVRREYHRRRGREGKEGRFLHAYLWLTCAACVFVSESYRIVKGCTSNGTHVLRLQSIRRRWRSCCHRRSERRCFDARCQTAVCSQSICCDASVPTAWIRAHIRRGNTHASVQHVLLLMQQGPFFFFCICTHIRWKTPTSHKLTVFSPLG